jgi:O-antigen ligase
VSAVEQTGLGPTEDIPSSRVLAVLAVWFAAQLFSNEAVPVTTRFVIHLRLDRVVLLACIAVYLVQRRRLRSFVRVNSIEIWMAVFAVVLLMSAITSGSVRDPQNRNISSLFTLIGYPMIVFYVARRLHYSRESIQRIMRVWLFIGLYLALTGIFEHYQITALIFPRFIMDPTIGIHYGRARGPFLQAAALGSSLCMILVVGLFLFRWMPKARLLAVFTMLLMGATIYFTYTRSNWLQLAASLLVLAIYSKGLRKYFVVAAVLLVVVYFGGFFAKFSFWSQTLFTQRQQPIESRKLIYVMSLKMFLTRSLTGFGYGTFEKFSALFYGLVPGFEDISKGEGSHNMVLGLLAETGLVGAVPYLLIGWLLLRQGIRLHRRSSSDPFVRDVASTHIAIVVGYVVQMQIIDVRWFNFLNSFVFVMGGIVFSLSAAGGGASARDLQVSDDGKAD